MQTTELELSLHVYISQVVGMTEVTDVIFVFFKTNLLYIIFFISFVQINFLNLVFKLVTKRQCSSRQQ